MREKFKEQDHLLATCELVKDEINLLRLELKEFKSDIIKWMFIFWIGSITTTLGSLFAFAKFFK